VTDLDVRLRSQLHGATARALSPDDLRVVSLLLDRDPRDWTVGEARTVEAIWNRTGEADRSHVLREMRSHAHRVLAESERPYRALLDEHRRIGEELGRVSHHEVFGRHLAKDQVERTIRETERQLRDEVRERFRPVFATALNVEHADRIAAQMHTELAKVDGRIGAMRQDAPRMVEVQAGVIARQRAQERARKDRDLGLRRQEIERVLREAGVEAPRPGGQAA
jgi:hypothetical protein